MDESTEYKIKNLKRAIGELEEMKPATVWKCCTIAVMVFAVGAMMAAAYYVGTTGPYDLYNCLIFGGISVGLMLLFSMARSDYGDEIRREQELRERYESYKHELVSLEGAPQGH